LGTETKNILKELSPGSFKIADVTAAHFLNQQTSSTLVIPSPLVLKWTWEKQLDLIALIAGALIRVPLIPPTAAHKRQGHKRTSGWEKDFG